MDNIMDVIMASAMSGEGSGGDIMEQLEAGTNITIEETADGKAKISASGEVSSEDTYARAEITAILDGTTLDSFGDVETALADKVDKVSGKGLSTEDYTTAEQQKLAGIAAGAEVNVQSDWTQTTDTADDYIKNKPTLGTAAAAATTDFATAAQGTKADSAIQGVKVGSTTLTPDSGKAVTITKTDITNLGIPAQDTTYEFESTYNASTNKAATMADIKDGVLTGYAQSSGNVAATDKVIEAIGKVEKKADTNESNISLVEQNIRKNKATINNASDTLVLKIPVTIAANTSLKLVIGTLTSTETDPDQNCRVSLMNGDNTASNIVYLARGNNVTDNITTTTTADALWIYASSGYSASTGKTVTVSNLMLCDKTIYDAGYTDYQPYIPTIDDIMALINQ